MMDELDMIKKMLIDCVMTKMNDLDKVDAKEMGEVIDIIKDIAETKYYCSFVSKKKEEAETK